MTPVDREDRPVMAAEVLAWGHAVGCRWCWKCGRSSGGNPECADCSAQTCWCGLDAFRAALSGGPVVVETDGTVRELERLHDWRDPICRCTVHPTHWDPDNLMPLCSADTCPCLEARYRLAPPAQDAENQEDNDG